MGLPLSWSFLDAGVCWSDGVYEIPKSKHHISGFQVSGVRRINTKAET